MAAVQFTFEIDEELKKQAEEICADAGTTLPEVINNFVARLVEEGKILAKNTGDENKDGTLGNFLSDILDELF